MARKRKARKSGKLIIGLIVFAILIAMFGGLYSVSGGSIMSIDSAKFVTKSGDIEDAFLIDVIVNQGGESITALITPEDVENAGGDVIPEAFKVTFDLQNAQCEYRIEETTDTLYKVAQSTAVQPNIQLDPPYNKVSLSTTVQNCKGQLSTDGLPKSIMGNAPLGGDCDDMVELGEWGYWTPEQTNFFFTAYKNVLDTSTVAGDWRATNVGGIPFYQVKNIGTKAFLNYQVLVKVENSEGVLAEGVLDSRTKTANLGDFGLIKLVGNLGTDEFCEIPAINYKIVENEGGKKFVERDAVTNYKFNLENMQNYDNDYFEYEYRQKKIDPSVGADYIFGSMSAMNNALNTIHSSNISMGCTIEGNQVVCPPETQIVYPELQLTLKSTFLGISEDKRQELLSLNKEIEELEEKILYSDLAEQDFYETQLEQLNQQKADIEALKYSITPTIDRPFDGIPSIGDITYKDIYEEDVTDIFIEVSNIGTDTDSFDVDLSCNVEIAFSSKRISLSPQESSVIPIKANGESGTYDCTITMQSVNVPENVDTKDVTIEIKERQQIAEPVVKQYKEGVSTGSAIGLVLIAFILVLILLKIKGKKRK